MPVAGMAELVDARDLKSCERKFVRVRFPLSAPGFNSYRGVEQSGSSSGS